MASGPPFTMVVPREQHFRLHVPDLGRVKNLLDAASMDCHACAVVLKQEKNSPSSRPNAEHNNERVVPANVRVLCIVTARGGKRQPELLKLKCSSWKIDVRIVDGRHQYTSSGQLVISRRWQLSAVTRVIQHPTNDFFSECFTLMFGGPNTKAFSFRSIEHASCTNFIVRIMQMRGHAINSVSPSSSISSPIVHSSPSSSGAAVSGIRTSTGTQRLEAAGMSPLHREGGADMSILIERLTNAVSRQADLLELMHARHSSGNATDSERDALFAASKKARDRLGEAVCAACSCDCEPRLLDSVIAANDKMNLVMRSAEARRESVLEQIGSEGFGAGAAGGHNSMHYHDFYHDNGPSSSSSAPPVEAIPTNGIEWPPPSSSSPAAAAATASVGGGGPSTLFYNISYSGGVDRGVDDDTTVPAHFVCPITLEIFAEPVVAEDGHTYERAAIERWQVRSNALSPMSGEPFRGCRLVVNSRLRDEIREWKARRADVQSRRHHFGRTPTSPQVVTAAASVPPPSDQPPLILL